MKLNKLLPNVGAPLSELEISSVTCDSRKVQNGSLYVCIDGVFVDGHKFAENALESGAAAIVCEKDLGLENQIIVDNTRKWFSIICSNWFGNPSKQMKIIGVTGTNGKTSTAFMIKNILENQGNKVGLVGTIQNMAGDKIIETSATTPDSYELQSVFKTMAEEKCDYCVMEVSSHALDQYRVYGVEFEVGLFTNLTQDHLDYHKTMENYLEAKKKLFLQCKTGIINMDDSSYFDLKENFPCNLKTYSMENSSADYYAFEKNFQPDSVEYTLKTQDYVGRIKMSTGGKFTVYNSMCAVAAALELGFSFDESLDAISALSGVKGRAEVVPTNRDFTVIIDYAHTPDGLENILKTFKDSQNSRLVAVFGCGGDRDKTKRPIMGEVASRLADYVIVTSDNPRSEQPEKIIDDIVIGVKKHETPFTVIPNRIDAIFFAVKNAKKGDIIVLAGKEHETYQILNDKTIHLDEREVVADALKQL